MMRTGVWGLVLCAVGCGTYVPGHPEQPDLPRLAELQSQAVWRWRTAMAVDVESRARRCDYNWGAGRCEAWRWACTASWTVDGRDYCEVWLSPDVPLHRQLDVMTHEIGHVLGAGHVQSNCGIMAPSGGKCISWQDLQETCGDDFLRFPHAQPESEVECE